MIPRETIDRIYEAAKIEDIVSDYVKLSRRGANLIGLCPFHNEKTGSFTVSPSKGIYKCFGCGASGHAVKFVQEIEQCSYSDALKQVAKRYHIEIEERPLTPEEQQKQDNRESMFVVNDYANRWFQKQLWESEEGKAIGLGYFRERGLRDDIIHKFQLGYSPERGNPLAQELLKQGYKEEFIVNDAESKIGTGLCGRSQGDGRLYDRFRDRVIFPIHSVSGKTVGFAGRILKKKENVGKYVNSPDSIIYSKTRELYGIFIAKQAISRADRCYLVEGQMDVISMHQAGIENVVASGGTALTKPQILLIKRFTSNITVLYDGDAAGIHAALRGIDMFLAEGFHVEVVLLPDGEDPDSYARSHNASDFIEYIESNQTDFIQYKLNLLTEDAGNDPQKRTTVLKDISNSIAAIPSMIARQSYIKGCAEKLHVDESTLMKSIDLLRRAKVIEEKQRKENNTINQEPIDNNPDNSSQNNIEELSDIHFTDLIASEKLKNTYRNLLQVIIRYGERPLYQMPDGSICSVGEYILREMENDRVAPPTAVYGRVTEEYKAHWKDEGFVPANYFKFHPDGEISSLAIDLIANKYQLSSIYSKQAVSENVKREVKAASDEDNLPALVTQLLLEMKLALVDQRIEEMAAAIKAAQASDDWEKQKMLLLEQPKLLEIRNQICRQLGQRVII